MQRLHRPLGSGKVNPEATRAGLPTPLNRDPVISLERGEGGSTTKVNLGSLSSLQNRDEYGGGTLPADGGEIRGETGAYLSEHEGLCMYTVRSKNIKITREEKSSS
jgi:hypothetical protein